MQRGVIQFYFYYKTFIITLLSLSENPQIYFAKFQFSTT